MSQQIHFVTFLFSKSLYQYLCNVYKLIRVFKQVRFKWCYELCLNLVFFLSFIMSWQYNLFVCLRFVFVILCLRYKRQVGYCNVNASSSDPMLSFKGTLFGCEMFIKIAIILNESFAVVREKYRFLMLLCFFPSFKTSFYLDGTGST